jgi:hypothetical protein
MSEENLVERVLDLALPKEDGPTDSAHRHSLWVIGTTISADALLRTPDEFTRERLLRGIENELREAMAIIPTITA